MVFEIYTDGACLGNRRDSGCAGGYAYIITSASGDVIKGGGMRTNVTNNQMELLSVIGGLTRVKRMLEESSVGDFIKDNSCIVYSDSQYVTENWNDYAEEWKKNGWRKSNHKPLINKAMWKEIDCLVSIFKEVKFVWVKGHASNQFNNMVDSIAQDFARKAKSRGGK